MFTTVKICDEEEYTSKLGVTEDEIFYEVS